MTTKPFRVMLVEPGLNPIFVNFANELASRQGIEVHFVTPKYKGDSQGFNEAVKRHHVPCIRILNKLLHLPTFLFLRFFSKRAKAYYAQFPETPFYMGLMKVARKVRPDVIIVNPLERPYSFQAARVARRMRTPLIVQTEMQREGQTWSDRHYARIYIAIAKRLILSDAKYLLCWTRNSVNFWQRIAPEYREKIRLSPAGVAPTLFNSCRPASFRKRTRGAKKVIRFLMVARLVEYKDHKTVLEAIELLRSKNNSFHCTFVGEGPLKEEIRRRIKELGLKGEVSFGEGVQYDKMPALYASHDCLILASRNEAIGMVVPEAMACGLPCVVPDTGGPSTYVEDGKTGLVFRTGEAASLASAMDKMLRPGRCRTMGAQAARSITARFTWERITDDLLKLMERKNERG